MTKNEFPQKSDQTFKSLVFIDFRYQINGYFLSILSLHFFTFLKNRLFSGFRLVCPVPYFVVFSRGHCGCMASKI